MDLNNMTPQAKIQKITELLNKMEMDINYSTKVATGDNKEKFMEDARQIAINATVMLVNGRINQITDLYIRNQAIMKWNTLLDNTLCCFPEFMEEKQNGKLK